MEEENNNTIIDQQISDTENDNTKTEEQIREEVIAEIQKENEIKEQVKKEIEKQQREEELEDYKHKRRIRRFFKLIYNIIITIAILFVLFESIMSVFDMQRLNEDKEPLWYINSEVIKTDSGQNTKYNLGLYIIEKIEDNKEVKIILKPFFLKD